MPVSAFLSYSHVDDKRLERLHKHLAMLRRDGQLQAWTDHDILAGDILDTQVRKNLDDSTLFIALVSPDYLASNYCYEKEFQHALALHGQGGLRIIAVVLEPCDWQNSPLHQFLVLPKDGRAVADWTNENTAYLNVVTEIRRVLAQGEAAVSTMAAAAPPAAGTSVRRVKVKQDFDTIQKADFADAAFDVFRSYFEKSCTELEQASDQTRARFELMDSTAFTCTIVNRAKTRGGEAYITVRNTKRGQRSIGDISYVHERHAGPGTSNGWFGVEADEFRMYLTSGMDVSGRKATQLTAEQAATQLWDNRTPPRTLVDRALPVHLG